MVSPVHVNPSFADRRLTVGGSDWLWVVTVIMGCSTFMAFAWSKVVGLFPVCPGTFFTGPFTESKHAEHERSIILP